MALSVSYEVSIRHSKSDPLIRSAPASNLCHYAADLDNYPHWSAAPFLKHLDNSLVCEQPFHSLEDLHNHLQDTNMLTIEGLRSLYNSCFTCGVSWYEDHVSLDCSECGGYAMERPCPECDGRCESIWRRDLAASHENRKARWEGTCKLTPGERKRQQLLSGIMQSATVTDNCDASLAKAMDALKTPL